MGAYRYRSGEIVSRTRRGKHGKLTGYCLG